MGKDLGEDHDCNIWNRLWKTWDAGAMKKRKDTENREEWRTATNWNVANQSSDWSPKKKTLIYISPNAIATLKPHCFKITYMSICEFLLISSTICKFQPCKVIINFILQTGKKSAKVTRIYSSTLCILPKGAVFFLIYVICNITDFMS